MKLIFASPTYGAIESMFVKSQRAAIMYAGSHGVTWVGDSSPERMGWAAARNAVVWSAIDASKEDDIDGVFWCDSDLLIPQDSIVRLASAGHDFVSGLYFQRGSPFYPLFAMLNKRQSFEFAVDYPADTIAPCDGVGFGCVYTSLKLLRAVSELKECGDHGPFGGDFGKRTYGEDFLFCLRAKKAGFRPYIDTGVKCEHYIGPEFSNEALFRRMRVIGETNAQARPANP